jgi:hypothetical protein
MNKQVLKRWFSLRWILHLLGHLTHPFFIAENKSAFTFIYAFNTILFISENISPVGLVDPTYDACLTLLCQAARGFCNEFILIQFQ